MSKRILVTLLSCVELIIIIRAYPSEDESDLKVWRVVSKVDGRLPTCELSRKKGKFVSEICMAVQPRDPQETTSVGFQYCDCPKQLKCSRSASFDDPFSYATIGNTQFKSCIPSRRIPLCSAKHRTVAKIWYGEELPLKVLVHCRCPRHTAWGELQCTSNGRICYVLSCDKS